jgi:hypothetical protein
VREFHYAALREIPTTQTLCVKNIHMEIDYKKIETKEQLLELIQQLSEENRENWENVSTQAFLEALGAWLSSAENLYSNLNLGTDANNPSWQLFADALQAALIYE